jgi:chromosome segregation ATPase
MTDQIQLDSKISTTTEELSEIKAALQNAQSFNVKLTEELDGLKKPSSKTIDMVLNDIHEVVCKITEQSNAGGELAKEYEAAMGRAEVNLKQIEITQDNLKSVIRGFREKLGQCEKDKMGLRKQVESLNGDIDLLEVNLGEKEMEVGKFEVEMRRLYGEVEDKTNFAEETWEQMQEMSKRVDAEANSLQVDYDQQEARTEGLKQDLFNCQADYGQLKEESGGIYLALNNKEQELSELKKYTKKMKGDIKDFRKRYKKET